MTKILVTGVNGFVGHHVAIALKLLGIEVIGASNQPDVEPDLAEYVDKYISCDLTSAEEVSMIKLNDIDAIINLAGFAKVGDSRGQGELYNRVNIGVHTVLYDECLKQGANPRIVAVSTGAVYDPEQPLPITEHSLLVSHEKTNEYVISKQLMEEAVQHYRKSGLTLVIARPFNHSGPGQLPGFLIPDLGEQVRDSIQTHRPITVGNLKTKRDYTDVRDVARAYAALALCDEASLKSKIYNICSAKSVSGEYILELLKSAFDAPELEVVIDSNKIRPNDVMDIYGSYEQLMNDTGWKPEIPIEQMIKEYVEWVKQS